MCGRLRHTVTRRAGKKKETDDRAKANSMTTQLGEGRLAGKVAILAGAGSVGDGTLIGNGRAAASLCARRPAAEPVPS